jgi:hypothetical protein
VAYTKTPENSTYSTVEIDLLKLNQSRGTATNKDANLINCYPEFKFNKLTKEQEYTIVKRPGYTSYISAPSGTEARGAYYWKDQDKLYYAVDDDILVYTASTGALVTTLNAVFLTTTGNVGFTEFIYDTGTVKIVAVDGSRIVTIDSANTVVTGADGDQPSSFIPIPIFLNGYLLIVKSATADIYNSDNNDPLAYTPGSFINAEIEPDQLKSITKLNNYIAVLGSNSIEYFYDAGIATGSPLQRNEPPVKQIGYVTGLAQQNNRSYFVGSEKNGTVDVYMLEDLKVTSLGHAGIKRYLSSYAADYVANIFGAIAMCNGTSWYILSDTVRTDVLELETQLWSQWASPSATAFPIKYSFPYAAPNGTRNLFILSTSLAIFNLDANQGQDNGSNFTVTVITAPEDFGTLNWKNMHRLVVWADYPTATLPVDIQWTDDDYQTYNTAQSIELFQDLPCIYQLGGFRQRAFKITYTGSLPLRVSKMECEINKGSN